MTDVVLKTINLSKSYKGVNVVDQVNMTVKKGDIYGFIGLNGAGKSTFIRLITGLTFPSQGGLDLFGESDQNGLINARKRMGMLIEHPAFFPHMTARENLEVIRMQRGIPGKECIQRTLDRVGLSHTGNKKVKSFSLGMKQRLGIAIALLNDPEFLILDEPINGLDPMGVVEIRQLLKQLNEDYGTTILISSHILSEVHQLATHYGIIHHGKLIEQVSAAELEQKSQAHLLIKVNDTGKAVAVLEAVVGTTEFEVLPDGMIKLYSQLDDGPFISKTLMDHNLSIEQLTPQRDTLEGYFTRIIKEGSV